MESIRLHYLKKIRLEINPDPNNMFSNTFLDQIFDLKGQSEKKGTENFVVYLPIQHWVEGSD